MIYAILASLFWGVMYYFQSKLISKGMNLVTMWGLNMIPNIVYLIISHKEFGNNISFKDNFYLFFFWITGSYLGSFFIYLSLKNTDVSSASIIEMTYPVFIMMLLFLIDGEIPNIKSIVGFILIFIGSIFILKK